MCKWPTLIRKGKTGSKLEDGGGGVGGTEININNRGHQGCRSLVEFLPSTPGPGFESQHCKGRNRKEGKEGGNERDKEGEMGSEWEREMKRRRRKKGSKEKQCNLFLTHTQKKGTNPMWWSLEIFLFPGWYWFSTAAELMNGPRPFTHFPGREHTWVCNYANYLALHLETSFVACLIQSEVLPRLVVMKSAGLSPPRAINWHSSRELVGRHPTLMLELRPWQRPLWGQVESHWLY